MAKIAIDAGHGGNQLRKKIIKNIKEKATAVPIIKVVRKIETFGVSFFISIYRRKVDRNMNKKLELDYYYGMEADQFSFIRVPKILMKDDRFRQLSSDAKLLYGLMLDRMALSIKNEWLDESNRVYIIYIRY